MLCNLQSMENWARIGMFWLALVLGASAATWHVGPPTVPPGGDGSLALPFDTIQAGLDAAAPGDEVLVQPGTYTGPGNYDLDFNGKAVTLRAAEGPTNTVIATVNPVYARFPTNQHASIVAPAPGAPRIAVPTAP